MSKIPKPIYEIIPYCYFAAGSYVIIEFPIGLGYFSGTIFIATAILVMHMRAAHRGFYPKNLWLDESPSKGKRLGWLNGYASEIEAQRDSMNAKPVKFAWRKEWDCGNLLVDAQHRHLLNLCEEIADAIISRRINQYIEFLLNSLKSELVFHFETEQKLLGELHQDISDKHEALHRKLLLDMDRLLKQNRTDYLKIEDFIEFVIHDLLESHIAKESGLFTS